MCGPCAGAGWGSAEPQLLEQQPTHYGPFLIENLLADACRYTAGRSTPYALGFAEYLAELWPQLQVQLRKRLRHHLQQLILQDDEARATGGGSDPYPLGMDEHRAAWLQVRQAWLHWDGPLQ